jgi:aspartyl-tRNA(Asn)/glutamyl-tRNA(Gln) amidotransferase subunit A
MVEIFEFTAAQLSEMIKNKEVKVDELTSSLIDRIEKIDSKIGSLITICRDRSIKQAGEIQNNIDKGKIVSPLAGIPMVLKDNICTQGVATTCASKMLQNFTPPYNATVASKLENDNAILLGKSNMDEFSIGGSTESSYFKKTKNPWDLEKVPGGSSGGSASAVAAGEAVFALGSDTGGSIRQPAAFCGVVGMKPTYGLVSRFGVVPVASSFDQVGPITKDVTDCALVLNSITGHDQLDSTSINIEYPDYTKALIKDVKNLKIGIPREYLEDGINPEVRESVLDAIDVFKNLGAEVEWFSFSLFEYVIPTYYVLSSAEASSSLARFDGIKYGYRTENFSDLQELYKNTRGEGFGYEVKKRIMMGTYVLSESNYDTYYEKALKTRALIRDEYNKIFNKYNLIIYPTTPTTAYKIGEKTKNTSSMYLEDSYTASANIAGLPAISVPCGFDSNNMPIGLQIIGKQFSEPILLRAAFTFEQNTEHHKAKPIIK